MVRRPTAGCRRRRYLLARRRLIRGTGVRAEELNYGEYRTYQVKVGEGRGADRPVSFRHPGRIRPPGPAGVDRARRGGGPAPPATWCSDGRRHHRAPGSAPAAEGLVPVVRACSTTDPCLSIDTAFSVGTLCLAPSRHARRPGTLVPRQPPGERRGARGVPLAVDVDSKMSAVGVEWKVLSLTAGDLGPVADLDEGYHDLASPTSDSGAVDYVRSGWMRPRPGCVFVVAPTGFLKDLLDFLARPVPIGPRVPTWTPASALKSLLREEPAGRGLR